MEWHYDLTGAEPILRDVPVYDAALIDLGELIMLGTTDPDSNADCGISFVTAYTGSSAEAVDALGVSNEKRNTSSSPSVATAYNSGENYSKVIVNPFAIYFAEYDQSTTMTITSTSTTTITIGSLEDDIAGGWVYIVAGGTGASGNTGALRFLSTDTTMDSALPTTESGADGTAIKILPVNHRLTALNTASTKLKSQAAAGSGVSLHIIENYIRSATHGIEPLRYNSHKALNSLVNAKFFADICLIDHIYNPNA